MPKFREISGQFVGYVPDGTDPDVNPDRETMNGRVTFTPVFTGGVIAFPELSPPEFAHPEPISARIIDGFVQVRVGTDDDVSMQPLSLMVTVDDEASQVWSWRAEFTNMRIGTGEVEVTIPSWSFRVPDGTGPVDLTELVPLKSGGSVDVTKGPRGAGLQNITAVDGQLVFEYTDGEQATIAIPEAVQGPQGEPGPAGADGEQGPEGPQGPAGEIPDLLVGNITDATPTGKNLMLAATEGAARNALGLQTGATAINGALSELENGVSNNARVWTPANLANYVGGQVEPLATKDQVAADLSSTVLAAAPTNPVDYTDRVTPMINVPARPSGLLWPQGISYDPAADHYYVAYFGQVESNTTLRVTRFTSAGAQVDYREIAAPEILDITSSEGIPFFYRDGELHFILRFNPYGRAYRIMKYSDGSLSAPVDLNMGPYRGDFDGDYFVCADQSSDASGLGKFFYFHKQSIIDLDPVLSHTVNLQNRTMRAKSQGITANRGWAYSVTGAAANPTGLSVWSPNGNQYTAFDYSTQSLGELVNAHWPGTIVDTSSFHNEAEGISTYPDGRVLFGMVVNNGATARFVIFRAGDPLAERVSTIPSTESIDTGWIDLPITGTQYFDLYNSNSTLRVRKYGPLVVVKGEVRSLDASWPGKVIAQLPAGSGMGPSGSTLTVCQASGNNRFAVSVSGANIILDRYGPDAATTGTWLNINAQYFAGA